MKNICYIFIISNIFNCQVSQGKDNNTDDIENIIGIKYQNVFNENTIHSKTQGLSNLRFGLLVDAN